MLECVCLQLDWSSSIVANHEFCRRMWCADRANASAGFAGKRLCLQAVVVSCLSKKDADISPSLQGWKGQQVPDETLVCPS